MNIHSHKGTWSKSIDHNDLELFQRKGFIYLFRLKEDYAASILPGTNCHNLKMWGHSLKAQESTYVENIHNYLEVVVVVVVVFAIKQ